MSLGIYYFIASTFSAARMGIGATSVLYMLNQGVGLDDVAIIKIIQASVIFFAEVPTGLVADTLGRKKSLLFAGLSAILSFICFIVFPSMTGFIVAEVFNALAISFWSGAFEALAVDNTQADKKEAGFIEHFFQKISKYSALATMISGLIGGMLGDLDLVYPFYFSTLVMVISMISIGFMVSENRFPEPNQDVILGLGKRFQRVFRNMAMYKRNAFRFALSSEPVRRFFIIQIAIQFALQPVFHYWQPYFKSFDLGIATSVMGYIFFAYVLSQTLMAWGVAALYEKKKATAVQVNTLSAIVTAISFFALAFTRSFPIAVLFFCLLQGAVNVFRSNIGAGFNRYIPSNERSTILSSVSFISRLGMFASLLYLNSTITFIPIQYSYYASLVAFLLVIYNLTSWNHSEKHQEALR